MTRATCRRATAAESTSRSLTPRTGSCASGPTPYDGWRRRSCSGTSDPIARWCSVTTRTIGWTCPAFGATTSVVTAAWRWSFSGPKHPPRPLGMVDEGIPSALDFEDRLVPVQLVFRHGNVLVPAHQGLDLLRRVSVPGLVGPARVAEQKIQCRAGHLALAAKRLERPVGQVAAFRAN